MKNAVLLLGTAALLAGCVSVASGAEKLRAHTHQTQSAAGINSVKVENVSGRVTVTGSNASSITIDAVKRGNNADAMARTHVDVTRNGSELDIKTRYDNNGIFGSHNGASVDYTIAVPSREDLDVANVSGDVSIKGVTGDVRAKDVSGDVSASLGRVDASRSINLDTISGTIHVQIAKNSDASVQAKTISGAIHTFFPSNINKGYVGESLSGSIGGGAGKMTLHTISGAINVSEQ